ncbi:hypothetical protein LVQ78_02315 [Buttiauxella sp. A2-C2_NF]|jgi:hypothetical protein|uniref:hypothetical protein n=1 Tax=Buttiauxella TaxID=82976 RepID=UPI0007E44FF5|nr:MULTISPECIES: hypothetical protein [Buttiauxella]MCE0824881.1 hypothetical protein [Buttiauxella ferragutiae]TDN52038.1 hypothetical protein EC843_103469 [Buttiauxella sp. JUb87]UNK60134.1 hypothetical protein MNO13_17360 [Buttiauxella ferragutiae]
MKKRAGRRIILLSTGNFARKRYWMKNQFLAQKFMIRPLFAVWFTGKTFLPQIFQLTKMVIPRFFYLLTFVKQCHKSARNICGTFIAAIDFIQLINFKQLFDKVWFSANSCASRASPRLPQVL